MDNVRCSRWAQQQQISLSINQCTVIQTCRDGLKRQFRIRQDRILRIRRISEKCWIPSNSKSVTSLSCSSSSSMDCQILKGKITYYLHIFLFQQFVDCPGSSPLDMTFTCCVSFTLFMRANFPTFSTKAYSNRGRIMHCAGCTTGGENSGYAYKKGPRLTLVWGPPNG